MAFERKAARVPARIGELRIQLVTPDPAVSQSPGSASYLVEVVYSDDSIEQISGDLAPELTQGQITGLLSFMADLRELAIDRILPE